MSTYYYLVCDRCSQGAPACSSVAAGTPMGDGLLLTSFLYAHQDCEVFRLVDEHAWKNISIPGPYTRHELPENDG